jgi:TolB-like protein
MRLSVLAATCAIVATAAGDALPAQEAVGQRKPVVAVMDFTNSAMVDHAQYEPFTVGLAAMLLSELRQNRSIELVERERLRAVLNEIDLAQSGRVDAATAAQVGKILGADYMIFGVFIIDRRGSLRIDARAVQVETTRLDHVETVSDDADNLLRAVRRLGTQLSATLRLPGREVRGSELEVARKGQVIANLKYARALLEEDRANSARAIELYREFLSETPNGYATALRREAEERIRVLTGGGGQR